MTKDQIEKAARAIIRLIDTGEKRFVNWVKSNDKKITKGLLGIYGAMPTTQTGTIDKRLLPKFLATRRGMVTQLFNKLGYSEIATDLIANFGKLNEANAALQNSVNGLTKEDIIKLATPVQRRFANSVYAGLVGAGLDNVFFAPVEQILREYGTIGVSLQDAVIALNDTIQGTGEYSKFANYALTTGRDALGQYDGAINQKIAQEFGLNAVVYVGTIVENSRAQCERWLGYDFIPIIELQDEIDWAFANGSGMISGTIPSTFTLYRGGYSCRHKAVPIRVTQEQLDEWQKQ